MARKAVIKTLAYSDIFDYPLTLAQIHKFLITDKKIENLTFAKQIKGIETKDNFYFLNGRSNIISIRKKREKESGKKIKKAFKIAKILRIIPTLKFLGISGSVSMRNAERYADIDLFAICSKGAIWSTRFFIVCFLLLLRVYRRKNEKNASNKFCLNMIIDDESLLFPESRRDIYSAHEIVQILPLFERDKMFEKFLRENNWIKKYLANFEPNPIRLEKNNFATNTIWKILDSFGFEEIARFIQTSYMGKPKGKETIGDGFLAFHPEDPRKQIVKTYEKKLKLYNSITLGH